MAYRIGDVVLVPFPFTDLSDLKVRPSVVISHERFGDGDITVARITSRPRLGPTDWGLKDWLEAGLRMPSWVRSKLITVDESLVQFSPGRLSRRDIEAVQNRIRLALGL